MVPDEPVPRTLLKASDEPAARALLKASDEPAARALFMPPDEPAPEPFLITPVLVQYYYGMGYSFLNKINIVYIIN